MSVIAAVDDLFFSVRIRETARQVGAAVDVVASAQLESEIHRRLETGRVEAVIIDLGAPSAVERVRALKSGPETAGVPIVGFVSHVATDLIGAARDAGCDKILARSAFTSLLAELLRGLSSTSPPAVRS